MPVNPSQNKGLSKPSQLMADRLFSMPRSSNGAVIGELDPLHLVELDQAVRSWLGLA